MIGTFDYQQRIRECAHWAEKAANDQAKGVWKEMEKFWRERADAPSPKADIPPGSPARSSQLLGRQRV